MTSETSLTIAIPKLGLTMTEATLAEWVAEQGHHRQEGEVVAIIETDKVSYEIGAPSAGTLGAIRANVGDVLPVGAVIAAWHPDRPPEATPHARDDARSGRPAAAASPVNPNLPSPKATSPVAGDSGRIRATPLARRLARQTGIDLHRVTGTGPRGRIKAADLPGGPASAPPLVEGAVASGSQTMVEEVVPPTRIHRTMADRMVEAKRDIPHFYMSMDVDATALLSLQRQVSEAVEKVSLTHLLLAALVRCLAETPGMRRVWTRDGLVTHRQIDVGLAVDTDKGLFSPLVRDLRDDDLITVARKANEVIGRARASRLGPGDMGGGSISISNAGMFGIRHVAPIIVPGQSAIVGVGAVSPVFRPDEKGKAALRKELGVVVSADHRVHTGAEVARFMHGLRATIEQPLSILLRQKAS